MSELEKNQKKKQVDVICVRVCSWCEDVIGFTKIQRPVDEAGKNHEITHGMCQECFDRAMRES